MQFPQHCSTIFRVITGTVLRDLAWDGSLRRVGHRTSWRGLFLDTCNFLKVKQSYTLSFQHNSLVHTPKIFKRQRIKHVRINWGHLLSSLCTDPPLPSVKIGEGPLLRFLLRGGGVCTQAIIILPHVREPDFLLVESGIREHFAGLCNPEYRSTNPKPKFHWQRLESGTWNPESTAFNPEFRTVLEVPRWDETSISTWSFGLRKCLSVWVERFLYDLEKWFR